MHLDIIHLNCCFKYSCLFWCCLIRDFEGIFAILKHNVFSTQQTLVIVFQFGMSHIQTVRMYPFMLHTISMSLFASIIGPFGGFFASGFKRAFNIKVRYKLLVSIKGAFTLTETETDRKWVVFDCVEVFIVYRDSDRDKYSDQCQWVSNPFYRSRSLSVSTHPKPHVKMIS